MKKLCLILSIGIILTTLIFLSFGNEGEPLHGGLVEGQADLVDLYNPFDKVGSIAMDKTEKLGLRFYATTDFNKLEFFIVSAGISRSNVTFSLYQWKGSYRKSVEQQPVFTSSAEKFSRNAWLAFEMGNPVGPGEYLVELSDFEGNVSFGKQKAGKENTKLYLNGMSMAGSLQAKLTYVNTPQNKLAKLSEADTEDNLVKRNAMSDTWVATDGLGRVLPTYEEVGDLRKDRYVGMFFWTWHASFSGTTFRNVTEVLKENPNIANDFKAKEWGNHGSYFWNEPIYGYYNGKDPWVFRKQAEILADAGVDVLIFDNSNNTGTFIDGVKILLETFAQARADGVKTPQISFLMNFFEGSWGDTVIQLKELYQQIYGAGKYEDLWFYWKGKPLMMAYPNNLNPNNELEKEILDFFTFRPPQPSYVTGQKFQGQWGWCSIYPQQVYTNEDGTPEQITVSVAQNHNDKRGLTAMNGENVFGRHWMNKVKAYDTRENAKLYGANFEEQFNYALKIDPEFIFITGWNEWRAGRYDEWCGVKNAFPDQFNDEYSRDLEPSKGDLKDHYYYQLVSFIRKYKGMNKPLVSSNGKTIDIYSDLDMWSDVGPYFVAYIGNTFDRNSPGYVGTKYTNTTGRNDIIGSKVTFDDKNVYFMVETAEDLTSPTDPKWMRLFIDVEGNDAPSWETFEYIVNRESPREKATLEKSTGGWNWEKIGDIEYSIKGKRLQIKIPKEMLGITTDKFIINFKWSDNMQEEGDIMDFYVNGDVAPGGRFKYQFASYDFVKQKKTGLGMILAISGAIIVAGAIAATTIIVKKRKAR